MSRTLSRRYHLMAALLLMAGFALHATQASADLPPALQTKVDGYKKKLVEWAANPVIVKAVKEANAKGGLVPGMTNGKWDELAENDPVVLGTLNTPASKLIIQWEADKGINKLFVRDEKGNMVAGSGKSLVYNASARPPFKEAIKGKAWSASEVKPDPTTQIKSVHVSAPVLDGAQAIGVIHTAVTAE